MEISLTPVVIGAISSVVTEIFKFVPFLNSNETTRAITSVVVVVIGVFISIGFSFSTWPEFFSTLFQSIVYALASYKVIVQPVATNVGVSTQK